MSIILAIVLLGFLEVGCSQYLTNTVHKTPAAAEKPNDLWCYSCNATEDGDGCTELSGNNATFAKKCFADEFICMVKQFSYTTHANNANMSEPKLWSLERKCINTCEPGCIIIGERTKLFACTSCCQGTLCNVGRADSTNTYGQTSGWPLAVALVLALMLGGL